MQVGIVALNLIGTPLAGDKTNGASHSSMPLAPRRSSDASGLDAESAAQVQTGVFGHRRVFETLLQCIYAGRTPTQAAFALGS